MIGLKRKSIDIEPGDQSDHPLSEAGLQSSIKRQRFTESEAPECSSPSTANPSIDSPIPPTTQSTPDTSYTPRSTTDDRACPHCSKTFTRSHVLRKHLKVHITERNYVCDYTDCGKAFRTGDDLKQHVEYNHLKEREHTCSHAGCNAAFNNAFRLRRHEKQVHQSGIRCTRPGCDQRFRNTNTLQRHLREHDGLRPYGCDSPSCDASFDTNASLRRHRQREHQTAGPDHWCSTCDLHFKNAKSLADHHRKNHIPCAFCDEVFDDTASLHMHQEDAHGASAAKPKRVECPDCSKTFSRVSNMNAHYRSVHLLERFVCGQSDVSSYNCLEEWDQGRGCGDAFTTKIKLVEHIKFIHLNRARPRAVAHKPDVVDALTGPIVAQMEYSFQCDVTGCESRFKRITDLERHKLSHETASFTGETASHVAEMSPGRESRGSGLLHRADVQPSPEDFPNAPLSTGDGQQISYGSDMPQQDHYQSEGAGLGFATVGDNYLAPEQATEEGLLCDGVENVDPQLFLTL